MLALLGMLLTVPVPATRIEAVPAAAQVVPLQRQLAPIVQPARDKLAEAGAPKRTQRPRKEARPPSRANRPKPEDCDPDDRRCEVQRKLGGPVDDRRLLPKEPQF